MTYLRKQLKLVLVNVELYDQTYDSLKQVMHTSLGVCFVTRRLQERGLSEHVEGHCNVCGARFVC
jgi:hypothetical protein